MKLIIINKKRNKKLNKEYLFLIKNKDEHFNNRRSKWKKEIRQ